MMYLNMKDFLSSGCGIIVPYYLLIRIVRLSALRLPSFAELS